MISIMATPSGHDSAAAAEPIRERLLAGALQVLQEDGPGELTVRRIAKSAGTTTMCLYTRFGSRDGLLDALYGRGFVQLEQTMARAEVSGAPEEAFVALLLSYREFAVENPALYGLLFERVLPGFSPSAAARHTALKTTFGLLEAQAGRILGVDAAEPRAGELAYAGWGLTHGLVGLELTHSAREALPGAEFRADSDGAGVLTAALQALLAGWPGREHLPRSRKRISSGA